MNDVKTQLQTAGGVAIVVTTPRLTRNGCAAGAIPAGTRLAIRCIETPALNRGVWRQVEHRIADLWTARYGEIWVIVGCISGNRNGETLSGTDIDVPGQFYQIVIAQEGYDIRAFALLFNQEVDWDAWPTRHLVTIDEIEELSGIDFLPDLPGFIQEPLEAELPSRLWPIRKIDAFKQIALRFSR